MRIITLVLLLTYISASAQLSNNLALNFQQSISLQTHAFSTSLMLGVQSEDRTQLYIGPLVKIFPESIGHGRKQYGIRAHAQATIGDNGRISPFLEVNAVRGEYYIFGDTRNNIADIKKTTQIGGAVGAGYMFTENLGLFAGYTFKDYNPRRYYKKRKSPYKTNAIILKASYSLPLGFEFNTSGTGQRRMW